MKILTKNKQAYHDYEITDTIEVGIVLAWYEVKAIKEGKINISDAIVRVSGNQIDILNLDIPLYSKASLRQIGTYDPRHPRRLLMHRRQLTKRITSTHKRAEVMLPLEVRLMRNHRIKILLWLAKRLRKVEKKSLLKEKDLSRQMDRQIKNIGL